MKYQLLRPSGAELGVTIDESAKDEFISLMEWTEKDFQKYTKRIEE